MLSSILLLLLGLVSSALSAGDINDKKDIPMYVNKKPEKYVARMRSDNLLDDVIKLLLKEGEVCRVAGHRWEGGCGVAGCAVFHSGQMRHCTSCDKSETFSPRVWK